MLGQDGAAYYQAGLQLADMVTGPCFMIESVARHCGRPSRQNAAHHLYSRPVCSITPFYGTLRLISGAGSHWHGCGLSAAAVPAQKST